MARAHRKAGNSVWLWTTSGDHSATWRRTFGQAGRPSLACGYTAPAGIDARRYTPSSKIDRRFSPKVSTRTSCPSAIRPSRKSITDLTTPFTVGA